VQCLEPWISAMLFSLYLRVLSADAAVVEMGVKYRK